MPALDGSDTSLVGDDLAIVLPGSQATAVTLPLVDDTGRLRGLLIGTGGANRLTTWYGHSRAGSRWTTVLDRLRSLDSAEASRATGRSRMDACARFRCAPVLASFSRRIAGDHQSVPALNRLAILVGDSTRSIAPATASSPSGAPVVQPTPGTTTSARSLYNAMRDALRRGDWAAFGRAFEALGRALEEKKTP
jgi:hypothetical protein